MISALQALQQLTSVRDKRVEKPAFQSMKISHTEKSGLVALFSTHPPLSTRIAQLKSEVPEL
jgi:Zn-dependent protease with chaperone function